jgi:cell division protein FtsI (penicillin-binding protein 3)
VIVDRIRRALTRREVRTAGVREPAVDWRRILKRRIIAVTCLLALWVVGIEVRLVGLQIFSRAGLVTRAERQQQRTQSVPAKRGDILDRRGRVLATSVDADTIYAVPTDIDNPGQAAAELCAALGDCDGNERQSIVEKLGKSRAFTYVRRQVAPDQARRVAALNLDGVGFIKESKRFYPNKELAAHLLGYVGLDNTGLGGLEFAYDRQISGTKGTVLIHTDAKRHAFSRFERPPTSGSSIELTIDKYLQHIAERELHAGVVASRAEGGTVIIMIPHTGEILAMANEPTFNPNAYRDFDDAARRNRGVQDLYEPGSTFKVVTASAAIEEQVMPIDTMIDTNPGMIRVAGRSKPVMEASGHNYGVLSFSDVIIRSSNVGAIKIGLRVGTERLSRFVGLFGFGHPVSPDFPGESPGIVWPPSKWTESALASVSMGYQVGVTPLQMLAAVSAVANGGEMIEPRIIRALYRDNRRYAVQPKIVRRTISAATAATVTEIMEGVVGNAHGTATRGRIPGYTIAGKTGTAAKLVNGRYSTTDYNASFVGFVPSRNPAVAIIVVTDAPHVYPNTGGWVSAPVFRKIAEATLRHLGIGPTVNAPAPVLVARRNAIASAGTAPAEPLVSLVADGPPGMMPDLRGLSAREALRTLVRLGMNAQVTGDGFVVSQTPQAGAPVDPGGTGRVQLARAVSRQADAAVRP